MRYGFGPNKKEVSFIELEEMAREVRKQFGDLIENPIEYHPLVKGIIVDSSIEFNDLYDFAEGKGWLMGNYDSY